MAHFGRVDDGIGPAAVVALVGHIAVADAVAAGVDIVVGGLDSCSADNCFHIVVKEALEQRKELGLVENLEAAPVAERPVGADWPSWQAVA